MDEEAAIEEQLRRSVRPDTEDVPKHVLHCLERDQADGVVQEMHRHICEHHQAGNEPQTPDHRSTFWRCRRIANLQLPAPRFLCLGRRRQASLRSLGCKSSSICRAHVLCKEGAAPDCFPMLQALPACPIRFSVSVSPITTKPARVSMFMPKR